MQMLSTIATESARLDGERPYVELIDGIEIPKVSPQNRHGYLQLAFGALLKAWVGPRGRVGTEIRFWLQADGPRPVSLVPDVAFISRDRIAMLDRPSKQRMLFAPDLAVEIRSPGDRVRNIARKIERYLAHGAVLVLDIDPSTETIAAHDVNGCRSYARNEIFVHPRLPGFTLDIDAFFREGDDP